MQLNYSIFYRGQIIDENKFQDLLTNQTIKVYYILHGLFGRGKNWHSVTKPISRKCEHIFLTLDLRNHGENMPVNEVSYDLMVSDLFKLTKKLNLKTISLIGHSMGGKASMLFALNFPDIIENLIVVDIAPIKYRSDKNIEIIDHLLEIDINNIQSRSDADIVLSKTIKDQSLRLFLLQNLKKTNHGYVWSSNLNSFKEGIENLRDFPYFGSQQYLKKTICIYGELSGYITEENKKVFQNYFPNIKFEKIQNTGHWLHAENPSYFVETICKYLI